MKSIQLYEKYFIFTKNTALWCFTIYNLQKIDLKINHNIYYSRITYTHIHSKMSSNTPLVLSVNDWVPSSVKYMQPKVNDRGGKSINMVSKQTNRSLHISTPLMMTWGIADFVDEKGESDGKFSMSLNFPNSEYSTKATNDFLQKLKDFENQILDDAVTNSELWWGEEMSREVAKHTFFPFLKYSKNKDTKKIDLSKPPSIRAKVPNYNGKWGVEIYDTQSNLLFPCDNQNVTPLDFVPKQSNVACVLQCGGIWIGGKGWGLTWKLIQCIVKPREVVSVYGKCQIKLSDEERTTIEKQELKEDVDFESEPETVFQKPAPVSTEVPDSDNEEEDVVPEPAPVVEEPKPTIVKKVVKKAPEAVPVEVAEEPKPTVVKKIVKKKV